MARPVKPLILFESRRRSLCAPCSPGWWDLPYEQAAGGLDPHTAYPGPCPCSSAARATVPHTGCPWFESRHRHCDRSSAWSSARSWPRRSRVRIPSVTPSGRLARHDPPACPDPSRNQTWRAFAYRQAELGRNECTPASCGSGKSRAERPSSLTTSASPATTSASPARRVSHSYRAVMVRLWPTVRHPSQG